MSSSSSSSSSSSLVDKVYDVIIIGAGISGLKSAIDLNKNGLDVIILEARDRLGGRLHTQDLDGVPIDLGASWFHDCLTNPLLAKNLNNPNINYYFDDGKMAQISSHGQLDVMHFEHIVEEFFKYIQLNSNSSAADDSLHNLANKYILEKKRFLTKEQIECVPQLARFIELWFGSCWDQTSGLAATELAHEGRNAFLTSGYYSVYENELKEFPVQRIFTKKIVNKITRLETIRVNCQDGSSYYGKNLIVTIPQPCLTSSDLLIPGSIEWEPRLPTSLTNYFPKMSFAALGKVAFEFDKVFWSLEYDRIWCISDPDEKSIEFLESTGKPLKCPIFPENGTLTFTPKLWNYPVLFVNVAKFSKKPILILLIQAPITHYIESLQSDDKVWEYFKPFFKQLGDDKVCKPKKILKTNWTQDPFARGSYTGGKVGGDYEGGINALIEGLPNVRFAGEHTIFEGNGCAHGAWLSGKREASYILKKYNKL